MALPVLTPEQRREALRKAAAARAERTKALAALKEGTLTLADVLGDPGSPLRRARVERVLTALPGVGKVTAAKVMEEAGVPEGRRVAALGSRQREQIAARFAYPPGAAEI